MLHFSEIYPFPSIEGFDYLTVLKNAKICLCIENNATGQFAHLMRAETGYEFRQKSIDLMEDRSPWRVFLEN